MHRIFQNFIDQLSSAEDPETLRDAMAATASALDLSCFAYLSTPRQPGSAARLISNYPSVWTDHYLQSNYERFDPVILRVLCSREPFEWGLEIENPPASQLQRELLAEAASYGIRCGFTIPIHDSYGTIAAMTFAADERRPQFERRINEHARILQLIAMYFHAHARRNFFTNKMIGGVSLSPRELECLEWAAQGKSAWETGRILCISRHTVAFHLDNAKMKLGVRTTVQAVAHLTASSSRLT
jgi:LuxR family transcriptional regulator, activator of conjugal transfer of Ti plasmids